MNAIKGAKYLLKAHAVKVLTTSSSTLVSNAFEMPEGGMLWPLMLGGPDATTATLSVAHLPAAVVESSFEVMLPSAEDHSWKPVPSASVKILGSGKATLSNVPLLRGCALVRIKPATVIVI